MFSVCPSVRLWAESCPLCIFNNTHDELAQDWGICITNTLNVPQSYAKPSKKLHSSHIVSFTPVWTWRAVAVQIIHSITAFKEDMFITRDSEVIMFSPCVFVCLFVCVHRLHTSQVSDVFGLHRCVAAYLLIDTRLYCLHSQTTRYAWPERREDYK